MTSGETAKGKFPTETIQTMNNIIRAAERYQHSDSAIGQPETPVTFKGDGTADSAVAKAAVTAAAERGCVAILCLTHHGTLPPLVSAFRPGVPIYAFCPTQKIARRLQIHRAIHPIISSSSTENVEEAVMEAKDMDYLHSGEEVVVVSMEDTALGRTATMKIAVVP